MAREPPSGDQVLVDFRGTSIRLTHERLRHIREHPEMVGLGEDVARVVRSPEQVIASRSDDAVHLYYRYYATTPVGSTWLCVVVKQLPADAFVPH